MKNSLQRLPACLLAGALLVPLMAQASVKIMGTRFIYPASEREITVRLSNSSAKPALVQSWLDGGDPSAQPGSEKLPFVILPPLVRVDGHKGQTVRIARVGDVPAKDRESAYWLNVLEIPPRAEGTQDRNIMQLAFRSRIKLFYRPEGLPGNPAKAAEDLIWTMTPGGVKVRNDSSYHVSFAEIVVNTGGKKFNVEDAAMVAPHSSKDYSLKGWSGSSTNARVQVGWIDDYGARRDREYPLKN